MKRFVKAMAVAAAACSLFAIGGCKKAAVNTYEGDYHYETEYGTYGVKVKVAVSDGVVKSVEIADSDYIVVSESWSGSNIWNEGVNGLLGKYKGKTVDELLGITVSCSENGQPESGQELEGLIVSGSTQSSGRLLLAVQDALGKIEQEEQK